MSQSPWCLRFIGGAVHGRTIVLRTGVNIVGSAGDCDVMLPGGDVQPRHLVFTVGGVAVTAQTVDDAPAKLNGEALTAQRRSIVPGDVLKLGQIEVQFDRNPVVAEPADAMFAGAAAASPAAAEGWSKEPPAPRRPGRWAIAGLTALAMALVLGVVFVSSDARTSHASTALSLTEIEKALNGFPEAEAVAGPNGTVTVRGFVESRARQQALRDAMAPYGPRVVVTTLGIDELIEQARRFVSEPGIAISYEGHGRIAISGTVEDDDAVRQQVTRMTADLHPTVLVTDRVKYRVATRKPQGIDVGAQSGWQGLLPAPLVSITEDASGLRSIQLANGARYYEGSTFRSGAELQRIDADGVVLIGGPARPTK